MSLIGLWRTTYLWTVVSVMTIIYFCVILAVAWVPRILAWRGQPGDDGRAGHTVASYWARSIVRCMPWWRVHVEGGERLYRDGPVVLVANHQSAGDIIAMYFLDLQFRWLSKDSVFRLPLIGTAMRVADYVPVARTDARSRSQAYTEAQRRLERGISMFFFPEGTRSSDAHVHRFRPGAFRLALEMGVPVQPVVLDGAHKLMPKNSRVPGKSDIVLRVLPPLWPLEGENAAALATRVEELIRTELAALRSQRTDRSQDGLDPIEDARP